MEKVAIFLLSVCHYNAGKLNDSKDEFVSLLPKLKTRVADTPGNVAEMLSKELARVIAYLELSCWFVWFTLVVQMCQLFHSYTALEYLSCCCEVVHNHSDLSGMWMCEGMIWL